VRELAFGQFALSGLVPSGHEPDAAGDFRFDDKGAARRGVNESAETVARIAKQQWAELATGIAAVTTGLRRFRGNDDSRSRCSPREACVVAGLVAACAVIVGCESLDPTTEFMAIAFANDTGVPVD